jgi:hypothetical protein
MNLQLSMKQSLALFASVSVVLISARAHADEQNPAISPMAANQPEIAIEGIVDLYLMNPDGEVDGVLLDNNTIVRFPPHLGDQLIGTVNPHDPVKVQGFNESSNTIHAWTITNLRNQRWVTDTPPGPDRMPSAPSANRQQMSVSGRIRVVTHAPQGEPDGAILIDGTNVHIAPASGQEYSSLFQPGQTLAATGFGTVNSHGRSLEATAIGSSMSQLQNLAATADPRERR